MGESVQSLMGAKASPSAAMRRFIQAQTEAALKTRHDRIKATNPKKSPKSFELERALEHEVCRADVVHWVRTWVDTYDPRLGGITNIPFVPFARQEEFLRWLREREYLTQPGLVEKSRDTGISWLCCAYAVHGWLYRPGFAVGFGSLKYEEVDELGNMDSLLEKCRFIIRNLPDWMKPKGYRQSEHGKFCCIINPANDATITGDGGDEMGRGSRKALFFVDESARLPRPDRVNAALSRTTDVRIDVSTPRGMNAFYKRRQAMPPEQVFRIHWRDDPRYDEEWYIAKCKELGDPVMIAAEMDISYQGSEHVEWPASYFEGIYFDDWPADTDSMLRVMALDPSKGKSDKSGDYSVWISAAIDRKALSLWVDCDADNVRPVEALASNPGMRSIVGDGLRIYQAFRPESVIIEINGFQEMVATACLRSWMERGAGVPPIYTVNHTEPKQQRIRTIAPLLSQKRLRVKNTPGGQLLVQQMQLFPDADHDDCPDALATAIELGNYMLFGPGSQVAKVQVLRA